MFDLFEWDDSDQNDDHFEDEYDDWWQQDERDLHSPDYEEDEEDFDMDDDDSLEDMSFPLFEDLLGGDWSLDE